MVVLLSLLAATTYGVSDFAGALVTRRADPWTVALVAQLAGGAGTGALALVVPGSPSGADLGWAVLAGAGSGLGTASLYRGLASGRMGVVAPVSGVGAAMIPVVLGFALGQRPGALAVVGLLVALPAIWLVAGAPARSESPVGDPGARSGSSGLVDGIVAGAGFGALFAAFSRLGTHSGLAPFALAQLVGALVVAAVAASVGARVRRAGLLGPARWALLPGVLGTTATVVYTSATHHGLLAVSAVITSLYPAVTVVLAAVVLRERVHGRQGLGLGLCAAAVVLVAAG